MGGSTDSTICELYKIAGININTPLGETSRTALMRASDLGLVDNARYLLKLGADSKLKSKYGVTALDCAAKKGYIEIAKMLIDAGALPNNKQGNGLTTLMCALVENNTDIAELLINSGAKVDFAYIEPIGLKTNIIEIYDTDLLGRKYKIREIEIKGILLESRNIDNAYLGYWGINNGTTPLMIASWFGNEKIMKLLIEKGADATVKDSEGMDAIWYAENGKIPKIVKGLRDNEQFVRMVALLEEAKKKQSLADGELSHLKKFAGEFSFHVKFFEDEKLTKRLSALLGSEYDHLIKNIDAQTPMELINNMLVLQGCAAHLCSCEEGIIIIDFKNDKIHSAILSRCNNVDFYSEDENLIPQIIKDWKKEKTR